MGCGFWMRFGKKALKFVEDQVNKNVSLFIQSNNLNSSVFFRVFKIQSYSTVSNFDMQRNDIKRIFHPNGAPSSVSSENFLSAKSLSSPMYTHNIAQTKYARISNLVSEEPRFTKIVNILA